MLFNNIWEIQFKASSYETYVQQWEEQDWIMMLVKASLEDRGTFVTVRVANDESYCRYCASVWIFKHFPGFIRKRLFYLRISEKCLWNELRYVHFFLWAVLLASNDIIWYQVSLIFLVNMIEHMILEQNQISLVIYAAYPMNESWNISSNWSEY